MQNIKDLQFQSELQRATLDYIKTLLRIADKYGADRDKAVFQEIFHLNESIKESTFDTFDLEPERKVSAETVAVLPYDREERLVFLKKTYERVMDVVFNCSANYTMTIPKKGCEEDFKAAKKQQALLENWISEMEAQVPNDDV